ncbi:MAG TPA: carboxypeptidase-like regulatory domain-containing protein [Bacteroidales bacterium]|nr:carboxypeptidase-like regulatory domain-containing protein [Bacteroidales bacterium]
MRAAFLWFYVVCIFLSSCQKETLLPDLKGSLVGYVYTFDEFSNQLEDRSDVLVTARGLKDYTAYTDKAGRFELTGLPTGTYELILSKPGFGTMKQFGIKHLGGTPTILGLNLSPGANCSGFFLYQVPETKIVELSVENDSLSATFGFKDNISNQMSLQVYLSDLPGFSITEAKKLISCYLLRSDDKFKGAFNYKSAGFDPGKKIYFKACILNRKSAVYDFGSRIVVGIDSYFDYTTYTTVYPNLGDESAQFSFVVPQ